MYSKQNQPKWWQLYLTFPLLIVLFLVEHRLKISDRGHELLQFGILLMVFLLIFLWLKNNSSALSRMDQVEYHRTFTVVHVPPYELTEADHRNQPTHQTSYSEIKGVLSDTFEMDAVEVKFIEQEYADGRDASVETIE